MTRYFSIVRCANGWIVRKGEYGSVYESQFNMTYVFPTMAGVADHILDQVGELKAKVAPKKTARPRKRKF